MVTLGKGVLKSMSVRNIPEDMLINAVFNIVKDLTEGSEYAFVVNYVKSSRLFLFCMTRVEWNNLILDLPWSYHTPFTLCVSGHPGTTMTKYELSFFVNVPSKHVRPHEKDGRVSRKRLRCC